MSSRCFWLVIAFFFCLEIFPTCGKSEQLFQTPSRFQIGGQFWNKFGYDVKEETQFEDDYYNHIEGRFETKYIPNSNIYMILSVEGDYFVYGNDDDINQDWDIRFYNAYITLTMGNLNVQVGNQIVRWGKADEVSPLDLVNPEDLRDGFVRPRTERKLPIPMVKMEVTRGVYTLQGLFIPFFEKSKLNFLDTDWALFDQANREFGPVSIEEEKPAKTLRNSEVGVRLAGTVQALDYAVSYLYTHDDLPALDSLTVPPMLPPSENRPTLRDLAQFAQATGQTIRLKHDRQHLFGVEFETVWGSVGLRGDIAYIYKRDFINKALQAISRPVFQYVLGADYHAPTTFYVNLQFSQSIIQDYQRGILFFDEITHGLNGEISQEFLGNNIKLSLRYFYNITRETYYLNPRIILQYWQNITFELGADILGGPEDSIVGLFRDNDQVYGILRVFL